MALTLKKNLKLNLFRTNLRNEGVSMIEILVTIGIAVSIFFIMANIFITHNRLFNLQSILAEIEINNYLALNRMQKLIKLADKVMTNRIINSVNYETSSQTLVLEIPSLDNSQNIIPYTFDYASFHLDPLDSTKLILSIEANPASSRQSGDTLISSFVDKLIFSYNDSDFTKVNLISLYLSNSRTTLGTPQKIITSTYLSLRNSL